jgi:hypothetical protein
VPRERTRLGGPRPSALLLLQRAHDLAHLEGLAHPGRDPGVGQGGHLLGAAGSIEANFSLLAIRDNVAPPTLNLDNPSVESVINLVPKVPLKKRIDTVLSNSFGFGGTNASLILRRV